MSTNDLAIEISGLRRRFGDVVAVDGLDLEVPAGICLGLLGPNGAGKSTTVHILVGLDRADEGTVRVLGHEWPGGRTEILERIGVQLQETQFMEKLTAFEVVRIFRSLYRTGREPDEVLEIVGLTEKRDKRYRTLSGGQKQRLALGCALVNHPSVLFLDEPTTGLDPQARRRVWEIVDEFKSKGGTVLLTTHYMDEAEQLCDEIVIVDHGKRIADGSPAAIIESLGAESLVDFRVTASVETSALESLSGVQEVRVETDRVILHVESAHTALPLILDWSRDAGVAIDDLRTHRPNLEDVFVSLTGRQLRDG